VVDALIRREKKEGEDVIIKGLLFRQNSWINLMKPLKKDSLFAGYRE
jgi:hypothetical protein